MPCISDERLRAVAVADDLLFTPEEFDHMKSCCPECFNRWEAECFKRWEEGRESGLLLPEDQN
jgi:hypothetical protein